MKKRIKLSILFGLISAMLLSVSHFNALCDDLRHNILRLHIIANSDSVADQTLKIEIRDEILNRTSDLFLNITDLEEAKQKVGNSLDEFEKIANTVIAEKGFDYKATAYLKESYFDTRVYDDFTLPAGYYPSLIIELGKAEGKNWWCVVFPTVCIPAASKGDLSDSVKAESANIAKQSSRYIMRFKTVEIYEKIKNLINK
jgi:stage II sporulation protein R